MRHILLYGIQGTAISYTQKTTICLAVLPDFNYSFLQGCGQNIFPEFLQIPLFSSLKEKKDKHKNVVLSARKKTYIYSNHKSNYRFAQNLDHSPS
jgi:hypothetical protein